MHTIRCVIVVAFGAVVAGHTLADEPARFTLEYAPAPVDNPLKGLVPYAGEGMDEDERNETFPHSLEFDYLPLSALMTGPEAFDWGPMEALLDGIASRGHQAVFRVYLEYPGKSSVIPKFLRDGGLKVHRYKNTNTAPLPPEWVETPDYEDPNLRHALRTFIKALGTRYDGDPRIGFITAGLLGTWGEWHTFPREELFASKTIQAEVMSAYENAFRTTPILLRYPAGDDHETYAPNARRRFGYHDDSFAWATLDTGQEDDDWFFVPSLRDAGPDAVNAWKTRPIGGEIRPEAWGLVFDEAPGDPHIQDFRTCVAETHATWLMDSGLFEQPPSPERRQRAMTLVREMGYAFHVPTVALDQGEENTLDVTVTLENRGVAPFYYDWPIEFALLDNEGKLARTYPGQGKLNGLLPGASPRTWAERFDLDGLPPGRYQLLMRAVHPLPNGKPLRFANKAQDQGLPGWLTLGSVSQP